MDVEKTIAFLLENQARFDARLAAFQAKFEADMEEMRKNQAATGRLIDAFARAGQAQIELHRGRLDGLESRLEADHKRLEATEKRLEAQEREFKAFLDRFDAFLRGRGNGHEAQPAS
jgi:hypothetical protein